MVTLTLRPWYQVHTMKTFNKRNEMHKYGVVYLNRGNDLYVAIDMSRMLTNFIGQQACKNWMLKSRTILFLKTMERTRKRWFCPFKSFWCQVKLWTQTQVTPRSISHSHCRIENLNDLLSLQYKENKGKFAATNGHLKAKGFSASGRLRPPDQGLCPWTPLGALPPDPCYRLALPHSPCSSPPKPLNQTTPMIVCIVIFSHFQIICTLPICICWCDL